MITLRQRLIEMLFTVGVVALAQGCANPGPPPPDQNELLAAGFKVLVATTEQQKEYAAYQRLRPGNQATPANQHAADMASYIKQDTAMEKATARDLSDPCFFWPSWDRLWLP
ncbi:MAG TPA: hypothetical protein VGI14_17550 [Casimicrobiaceae bacterium]|jgi:hypothetical protein